LLQMRRGAIDNRNAAPPIVAADGDSLKTKATGGFGEAGLYGVDLGSLRPLGGGDEQDGACRLTARARNAYLG
jgi:hypothetical protein